MNKTEKQTARKSKHVELSQHSEVSSIIEETPVKMTQKEQKVEKETARVVKQIELSQNSEVSSIVEANQGRNS